VRNEQVYELAGNRGLYRDGWEAVTNHRKPSGFDDAEWELYHVAVDRSQTHNLAASEPERVADLSRRFDELAHLNQIYPMDEGSGWRWIVRRPDDTVFEEPVTIWPGTPPLEHWRSIRLIWQRTTTITVPILHEAGDRGVLVSHGDQGGGYVVYVDGDRAHLVLNDGYGRMTRLDGGPVPPGEHTVVVRIEAPGGWRWNLSIGVDGGEAARVDDLRMLFPMAPFEGISVGTERRSPVDWDLFQREGPFPYNGTLHHVRYEPGDPAPDAPSTFVELAKQLGSRYE
jgi:arylsulfatase